MFSTLYAFHSRRELLLEKKSYSVYKAIPWSSEYKIIVTLDGIDSFPMSWYFSYKNKTKLDENRPIKQILSVTYDAVNSANDMLHFVNGNSVGHRKCLKYRHLRQA